MSPNYDYIIAGAGAAGLSLLWHLSESSLSDRKILLVDRSFGVRSDKSWCFWDHDHPFSDWSAKQWSRLRVVSNDIVYSESLRQLRYHCLQSSEFSSRVLSRAKQSRTIDLLESDIQEFGRVNSLPCVSTDDGTFTAPWIFQSVFPKPGSTRLPTPLSLLQHFRGWEVETDHNLFDPEEAVLMDLDTLQRGGLTFFYLLPFTPKRALVEYTLFSAQPLKKRDYDEEIQNYLKRTFDLDDDHYTILRCEEGIIPMNDETPADNPIPGILNIGLSGRSAKASTGYAFSRIQRHCKQIVESLETDRNPPPLSGSPLRFRLYDLLLLYLLKHDVPASRQIFHQLFSQNSLETVLRFMDEKTHPGEDLSILASVPPGPFLHAIFQLRHRLKSELF